MDTHTRAKYIRSVDERNSVFGPQTVVYWRYVLFHAFSCVRESRCRSEPNLPFHQPVQGPGGGQYYVRLGEQKSDCSPEKYFLAIGGQSPIV